VHICWSVCTQACCINRNCNPQHNLLLNPKQLLKLVQHPDWNQASSWKQVLNNTSGDSAFSHIKFTSTLVKSISNSATISRVKCLIALMNFRNLPCHEPYPDFYFCLE